MLVFLCNDNASERAYIKSLVLSRTNRSGAEICLREYPSAEALLFAWENVQKHCDEVESIYRKMRGWRHDYHSHIQALQPSGTPAQAGCSPCSPPARGLFPFTFRQPAGSSGAEFLHVRQDP